MVYQKRMSFILSLMCMAGVTTFNSYAENIVLASEGKAVYSIVNPQEATEVERFAAEELKRYLDLIAKADFQFAAKPQKSLILGVASAFTHLKDVPALQGEEYCILIRRSKIYLLGGSGRGVLYAAYHFLSELGCRRLAPSFDFYENLDTFIPVQTTLNYRHSGDIVERPAMKYRKYFVEEGLSHTTETLLKMIEWMPTARINVMVFPINYQGHGRVKWDNWRKNLIPELQKRAITIEVGGHGYQNFINPNEDGGELFSTHPHWFGMDPDGARSANPRMVFCTSNPDAVAHLHANIATYLRNHPEIGIFDFWPPDSETWCACPACAALGSPADRHALLVSATARFLSDNFPKVQLQCLAYSRFTEPSEHEMFHPDVLLDFCPINQSFEFQIYDRQSSNNHSYAGHLGRWIEKFKGDVCVYSYYRKYAWRSLPVLIPHYMQNDLKYYRDLGVKGISVYAEPGDWFTYGVNQYVLSRLAWNPDVSVDGLIADYCERVFGPSAKVAIEAIQQMENVVRFASSIPYTENKTSEQYRHYISILENSLKRIESESLRRASILTVAQNLGRLGLMLQYAMLNAVTNYCLAAGEGEAEIDGRKEKMRTLLRENAEEGVFIYRGK